jgi:hypothetical protein
MATTLHPFPARNCFFQRMRPASRRYNGAVEQRPSNPPPPHPKHHVYALETTGLLIISILLLIITLVRYGHNINWGAR